ncbi:serine kinase [Caulobacter sp. 17J80-11]|uniref:HPr kinase/phosphorylase n=1 Tax=Caulobacter sp. 17J80-11 TaxID=2763502 RepID=UPI00165399FE|nr:serine kinase [Caulobacter sp. 17J80-11]
MIVHATSVARFTPAGWRAALLFGRSGAGKSDLALRAMAAGWRLVSDDYTRVWASGGVLWARAPETIEGLIEARAVGILTTVPLGLAPVACAVECEAEAPERLPEAEEIELETVNVPRFHLRAVEASALAKLDRALSTHGRTLGPERGSAY